MKRRHIPDVTERLIRELEKILKPRQKSIEEVKRRFGFPLSKS